MSSSDSAVVARGLSKKYIIGQSQTRHSTLAESLLHRLRNPFQSPPKEVFWALNDIDFELRRGDVVGVVGRNGAGKSTLLKVLSRITEPTSGEIDLYGRVGSLLEVGTGFHPELTGRENIYLNGSILGMRKCEIDQQFDAIVDFSGVEKFLDTPVKRYSSGMYVRLAFAVAAHLKSDILLVDEVLAVGDAEFQDKCLGKMHGIAKDGRTVVFVSHSMNSVSSLCNVAMFLESGKVREFGKTENVIEAYFRSRDSIHQDLLDHPNRAPWLRAHFSRIEMLDADGRECRSFAPGATATVRLYFDRGVSIRTPRIGIGVTNSKGERVFAIATFLSPSELPPVTSGNCVGASFSIPNVVPGSYSLDISVSDGPGEFLDEINTALLFNVEDINILQCSYPYFSTMGHVLVRSDWSLVPAGLPEGN